MPDQTGSLQMLDANRTWSSTHILAVDVEGNGDQPHELIELGIVSIINGAISGEGHSWLVRPQRPVTNRVVAIHGITNEQLSGCPRFEDIALEVREVLGKHPILGHRVQVDREVIARKLSSWQPVATIDTWRLARRAFPNLTSYSLAALVAHFELPTGGSSHRALPDAMAAAQLFLKLMSAVDPAGQLSIAQVVGWAASNAPSNQMEMF